MARGPFRRLGRLLGRRPGPDDDVPAKAIHLFRDHVEEGFPRPLTDREGAVLTFLLAVDAAGIEALRRQAEVAVATARCACGCGTISLDVDRSAAPRSSLTAFPLIEADAVEPGGPGVLLFGDDGWLSAIECLYFDDVPPAELPAPAALGPPRLCEPPTGPATNVLAYFRGEAEYVARCTSCERERAGPEGQAAEPVTFVARLPLDVQSASLACDHGHPYVAVRVDAEPPEVEPTEFRLI
ncbi:MAG TPA: hypothetical protein VLB86_00530 [Gaiellaceae bacterium]|nr:hypothetical protein [Gaiellaceae bacterium]